MIEQASEAERRAMQRALELSLRGPERDPNPRVGCVILDAGGRTLSEGWHLGAGTPHAETAALAGLPDGAARGATAVVTLEPCDHHGRTGPCSQALLDAGVTRVVYGVPDPGERSRGGAARLRQGGVDVVGGVLGGAIREILGPWLALTRWGRPAVTVKWAASLDGRAAAADGSSRWITGAAAREDVHRERAAADSIVVGTGTVLADDPALTARTTGGGHADRQPVPVVLGRRAVPEDAAVRRHPAGLLHYPDHDLPAALEDLRQRGIQSVFVEGGPTMATAFLRSGLADRVVVYLAPVLLGGPRLAVGDLGIPSLDQAQSFVLDDVTRLGDDVRLTLHPAEGP